jgi:DNA-binding NtrC family response regulator
MERAGVRRTWAVDARIMSATHCDLAAAAAEGRFRKEPYHRIGVVKLEIPPLCRRWEGRPYLVDPILKRLGRRSALERRCLAPALARGLSPSAGPTAWRPRPAVRRPCRLSA